ncbi:MAG: TRAP transporter small permease [Parasporobacterium sp.]|nr:TRAP transporter small permease [Parasporobacterium sp.]
MRYVFNSPIPGQQELAELGTVIVVYFGLPFATRNRGHVRVETIPGKFPLSARSILYGILNILCFVFLVLVTIKVFQQGGKLALTPNNATLILRIPNFYIYYVASVGAAISAIEFLLDAVRYFIECAAAHKNIKLEKGANA